MSRRVMVVPLVAALALAGCATIPVGPSVMVLPGVGKPFDQFQADDAVCRDWAFGRAGIAPREAAEQSAVTSAVIGTVVGAGLGAAIGAASGHAGAGAAIGAGGGLLAGTAAGANTAYVSGALAQRRYDIAYQQCMYAKGNQIPAYVGGPRRGYSPPPPPPPPPPPGAAPLPPPPPPPR